MKNLLFILLSIMFINFSLKGQEGNWDAYVAMYQDGPGSIILNMDLIKSSPKQELPFLLVTGVTFTNCDENGFPNFFDKLYEIEDGIESFLTKKNVESEAVGIFTYQCERLNYIYLNDTSVIRRELSDFYTQNYGEFKYYINITQDSKWEAFLKFLFPNEEILEYMSNEKVIAQLESAGDNLTKERQVDHWIYFNTEKGRSDFIEFVQKKGFKIEGKDKINNSNLSYQLHISRIDFVDRESISEITIFLRKKAIELDGDYDGWETFIVN